MSRRGENIYKRRDGRWEGRYIAEYDIHGKAKYHSVYAHSYNEVKQKLLNAKANSIVKPSSISVTISVKEWFEQWITKLKNSIKESTYTIYKRYIDNHINPFFNDLPLKKINEEIIQRFVDSKNNLSPATVHDIFIFFRTGIQQANKCLSISIKFDGIKLPKYIPHPLRVFSKEEQHRIENVINSPEGTHNDIGILICLYTGLRIGEVCVLEWNDIDFLRKVVVIRKTIQRIADMDNGGTKIVITEPKSVRSVREIPLPEFLVQKLKIHKQKHGNKSSYILNIEGNPMEPRTYQYRFQKLLKIANVEKANFHTLRHPYVKL